MGVFKNINVIQDKNAKSLSYYFTTDVARIDDSIIDELIDKSVKNGKCNARISLHTSPDANFHEMVIVEYGGRYYRPHKHLKKGESCHIIKGRVAMFAFDNDGSVVFYNVVGQGQDMISRVGINMWHTVIPLTEYAVYHESKPGPYLREEDSIFPTWAPDGSNLADAQKYIKQLLNHIGEGYI